MTRKNFYPHATYSDSAETCAHGSRAACQTGPVLSDLADEWLSQRRRCVKLSTYIKYRNLLESYILPEVGSVTPGGLSEKHISDMAAGLMARGGARHQGLSPRTVADAVAVLKSVLKYAEERGLAVEPAVKSYTVKRTKKELTILSHYEQKKLWRYLCNDRSYRNLGILLTMFTGIRIGELCALKWGDVSLSKGEESIRVSKTMQRVQVEDPMPGRPRTQVIITEPKSVSSVRVIPLLPVVYDVISGMARQAECYVLTGSRQYMEPRMMQNYFKTVLRHVGVRSVGFHTLRHTFATRCVEAGFDIKILSDILGHANVNITMNYYVHPTMAMKRDNMNRLSEFFAGNL